MNTIFAYTDYRQFLKERYAVMKSQSAAFSYRNFSKRAGFASPNFLKLVMEGQRNLTPDSTHRFAQALKLSTKEQRFFDLLVQYNQAKDSQQKQYYYERLLETPEYRKAHHLEQEQYVYLSHWYYPAIAEMTQLKNFKEDPQWIAGQLGVSVKEVKDALDVLQTIGLLTRSATGQLESAHAALTTGPEASSLAAFSYHTQVMDLAKLALQTQSKDTREFAAITMAVSEVQLTKLKEMIRDFRKLVVNYLSQNSGDATAVYQLGVQLFALGGSQEDV